jgi:membrane-bound lytic murein transglycosylase D
MKSGLAWILLLSYLFDVILLQNEFRKFVFLGDVLQIVQIEWKRILPVVILMVVLTGTFSPSNARTESDTFPLYPCIQPNVNFWIKIYTQYSSDQGVIHDKRQMDRIYGIIELVDPDRAGGRKINKKRIKKAKKKYKAILTKLMKGQPPSGPVEMGVADLFGLDAKASDYRSAIRNLRCQTGQKDRFSEGLIRSGAYIEEIKQIFRDLGLPEDLAYLPHVESSFNPKAYSKFGAAGMWQFTRSTGRGFMKIGYAIDERRDPIISSHAAAKLLHQNYRKLKTWPMAITAYNHGTTGMRRAQRKKGSYERIFKEYRSRIFKFASRNFYSEFLAARESAKNYRQYFGDIKMDTPIRFQELTLAGYVSIPEVARYFNIDMAELRELNPALRRPVFRGQKYVPKGYRLRFPERNDKDWEQLIAQLPQKFYRHNQKRSHIYTVRRGDTAGKIAKVHRVKLNDLIAVNNLGRKATIYVNQNLKIPSPEEKPILIAQHKYSKKDAPGQPSSVDAPPTKGQTTENIAQDPSVKNPTPASQMAEYLPAQAPTSEYQPEKSATASDAGSPEAEQVILCFDSTPLVADIEVNQVEVSAGDLPQHIQSAEAFAIEEIEPALIQPITLSGNINTQETADAVAFEVSEDEQAPASLPVSQSKQIGRFTHESKLNPEIVQGHFAVDRVLTTDGKSIGFIRVEAEETLGHYAEWLEVSAHEIRRLNGFRYGQPLHLSQQIKIPLNRVAKEAFEEKRFEFHQELAEDFFTSYRVEKVLTYAIKKGDNIWTLSRREFEVPLWLIKRFNAEVDFSALIPSQKLLIPIVEKNA